MISALLANYNHAPFLPRALKALCEQTHPPLEVIVVDDASTDNSVEVIQEMQKRYPIIRLFVNEKQSGANFTFNRALQNARGQWLAYCGADDMVLPTFFEKAMSALRLHPTAGIFMSLYCTYSDDHPTQRCTFSYRRLKHAALFGPEEIPDLIRQESFWIPGNTTIVKRSAALAAGGYREELGMLSDWYMLIAIALRHGLYFLPEVLTLYRITPTSFSYQARKAALFPALMKILEGPDSKDIYSSLLKSSALSQQGRQILPFFLKTPRYWPHAARFALHFTMRKLLRRTKLEHRLANT